MKELKHIQCSKLQLDNNLAMLQVMKSTEIGSILLSNARDLEIS